MELNQLLTAIVEVSQSIARMPCPPDEKEEVLDKVKVLFTCYNSVASSIASEKSKTDRYRNDSGDGSTRVKETSTLVKSASPTSSQVDNLRKDMDKMEEKFDRLQRELTFSREQLDKSNSATTAELSACVSTINQIKSSHNDVCSRVSQIENKSNDLEMLKNQMSQITAVVESHSGFQSCLTGIQDEMLKLHQEIAGLEKVAKAPIRRGPENPVAFAAKAVSSRVKYTAGEVLQFKAVVYNQNNPFDPERSVFTAPSPGVYVFSSSISTNSQGTFEAAICCNEKEVSYFGTTGTKDLQTCTTSLLQLRTGDKMSVQIAKQVAIKGDLLGVEIGGGFSNFIGFKLF